MKKIFQLLLFVCFFVGCANAQDVIVLLDASEIEAKVLTVGVSEISYKKWTFQDGPTYQIDKKDVFYIKYSNGDKDVINSVNTETPGTTSKAHGKYIKKTLFNSYLELGCPFLATEAGPSFNVTLGARFYDYGFAGITAGVDALFGTRDFYGFDILNIPILADLRVYYPVNANFSPFFEFCFGPNVVLDLGRSAYSYYFPLVGARVRLEGGIEYRRFVAGLGYDCIVMSGTPIHLGYAKVGVRLGKIK